MNDEYGHLEDEYVGFSPEDANMVMENYVCSVCHGSLFGFQVPGCSVYVVVCLEHGNVEKCGRVTKATVAIEEERGYRKYNEVIRNLPDLWGELLQEGWDYQKAKKIRKEYVCAKCCGPILMELKPGTSNVELVCTVHGNINQAGYVKKGDYYANRRTHGQTEIVSSTRED